MTGGSPSRLPSRRRPPAWRLVLVGLPVVLLLGIVGLLAPAGPAAAATPAADVTVTALSPIFGRPGERLRATGTVHNVGAGRLADVQVRLLLSDTRVSSRGELAAVASGDTEALDGEVVDSQDLPGELVKGQQASFDLALDLADAGLVEFGVYVVGVEVVAQHRDGFGRVAIERTFLPWMPRRPGFRPTGFAWVWPVMASPTQLANGTFVDDRLARQLGPGGRLGRLVTQGARLNQKLPLIWVVDPELLEAVTRMSRPEGYTVTTRGRGRVAGVGSAQARLWLQRLRSATARSTVVAAPYADPDLVALHRHHLLADLVAARTAGVETASRVLGRAVRSDVVWPVGGVADRGTLSVLRGADVHAVILDGRAAPPVVDPSATPTGRITVTTDEGPVDGVLAEPVLADLLARRSGSSLLNAQRFVAETAMITAELPSVGPGRAVLVVPPRRWSPPPELIDRVVDAGVQAPWLGGTTLDGLLAIAPPDLDREPMRYPRWARRSELPKTYLTALRDMHRSLAVFSAVLTDREAVVPAFERAMLRLESSWWRRNQERSNRLATERDILTTQRMKVRVLPGSYTFGSKSGTIPLTITNGLDQDVVVDVRLTPQIPRLEVDDVDERRIGATRKVQVEVPARARANGVVYVDARLYTPGGTRYAQPVVLRVRVTQYGTLALVITIGAAGVLFLTAGVRLVRRGLQHRERTAAGA